jgi:hypothetical protein
VSLAVETNFLIKSLSKENELQITRSNENQENDLKSAHTSGAITGGQVIMGGV